MLLARVLAVQAPVRLLNEPPTHLNARDQRAVLRSLVALARAGVFVLAVLHDLTLALQADRLLAMERGCLVADGPPDDAMLRDTLVRVFEHALSIEAVATAGGRCWVVVTSLRTESL